MEKYCFRRMTPNDLPMVNRWLETPAVGEWWVEADGQPAGFFEEDDLNDEHMAMWIVSHEDHPFAFIQDYDPHAWTGHHFNYLPPGSRGIDQFIGEPSMINCGHGSAFIRAHADALLTAGAPAIGTDPHPTNARAIRAYEKAGFVPGEKRGTEWGYCLLTTRISDGAG